MSEDLEQGIRMVMCAKEGIEGEGSGIHSHVNADTHMSSLH